MIQANPLSFDEQLEYLDSRLNNYRKRFTYILKTTTTDSYVRDLENLIRTFENVQKNSQDIVEKDELLENFSKQYTNDFHEYLQKKLDEQFLNEAILKEQWFLQQLMAQVSDDAAEEILKLLPQYKAAINTLEIDKKFELYAKIAENMPYKIQILIYDYPESKSMLNVHLQYIQEYLNHLLLNDKTEKFKDNINAFLKDVERARLSYDYVEKQRILERFDDVDTAFGRFLNNYMKEFEINKFSLES